MTNEKLPEPGPARDRMVAEVVGWEEVPDGMGGTLWIAADGKPTGYYTPGGLGHAGRPFRPSEVSADALAALEAWRLKDEGRRSWQLASPDPDHGRWTVALWWLTDDEFPVSAESTDQPTLPSAATAALLATGEGT